ncbi:MAG: hypothetical protein JST57_09650 [Bacteroidetes bacterium]|nr:hypothetical protein [Bacteroidota bacterium]
MKKVLFCYLDVLGFKNKLETKSEEQQSQILNSLFGCISFSIPQTLMFQADSNQGLIDLESINTNSILISDSLIVWTNDCNCKSIIEFTYRIQRLIRNAFIAGFPLRGTIEYGSIYHEERNIPTKTSYNHFNLIGGNALMNAYKSEQEFQWAGCIITQNCTKQILSILDINDQSLIFKNKVLIKYDAPKKNGETENLYVINWVDFILADYCRKNKITELFMQYCKPESLHLAKPKIDNTQKFLNYIVKNNWGNKIIGVQGKRQ